MLSCSQKHEKEGIMRKILSRVFDKIFSLDQIGSGLAMAKPMYF